jgi:thymidylate synthase (FAD)
MKIVKAGYEILTPITYGGIEELQHIEKIGRTCYKSEDKITDDGESAKKFVKMLIGSGHEAMIEHSSLSVKFTVDRGVTHEMVRHRIASFAQESTRYCNYSKDKFGNEITVIAPCFESWKTDGVYNDKYLAWLEACECAEKKYFELLKNGATPQEARTVLPTSTKAEIIITANYREWRTFFKLRTPKNAHPQIREVAIPLLRELKILIPVVFDDIEVDE